jgi:hypothetical protein
VDGDSAAGFVEGPRARDGLVCRIGCFVVISTIANRMGNCRLGVIPILGTE